MVQPFYKDLHLYMARMKISDEQLVKKCLENDGQAQKYLFDVYSKRMMGVCLRYTQGSDEAEDVLQMGFIKVFEKLKTYDNKGSLEGWIRRIIVNTALDNIRRNKKFAGDTPLDKVDYQLTGKREDPLDQISAQELLGVIRSMPVGFRTVFNMYVIEGFSHKEIAEKLNISVNTSKSQLSRSRVYLQKVLVKDKVF